MNNPSDAPCAIDSIPDPEFAPRQYVQIDWTTLEIVLNRSDRGYEYRIDLERCQSSAQMLDWIFQVASKPWCDAQLLKELVEAFEEASFVSFSTNAQGSFCPFGQNRVWKWKRFSPL